MCGTQSGGCYLAQLQSLFSPRKEARSGTAVQPPASATVRLTTLKPSSISVSVHEVPLAFDFQPSGSTPPLAIPVTTIWNVNPLEVRGVELVAYFADPDTCQPRRSRFLSLLVMSWDA